MVVQPDLYDVGNWSKILRSPATYGKRFRINGTINLRKHPEKKPFGTACGSVGSKMKKMTAVVSMP